MSKSAVRGDWREARRRSARAAILDAAWSLVREDGLAALSIRDLAARAGITTPTVYAYFDSKHAIYDAMFGEAATEFADVMTAHYEDGQTPGSSWPPASAASSPSAPTTSPGTSSCSSERSRASSHRPSRTSQRCGPSTCPRSAWPAMASRSVSNRTCRPRSPPDWSTSRSPTTRAATAGRAWSTTASTCSSSTADQRRPADGRPKDQCQRSSRCHRHPTRHAPHRAHRHRPRRQRPLVRGRVRPRVPDGRARTRAAWASCSPTTAFGPGHRAAPPRHQRSAATSPRRRPGSTTSASSCRLGPTLEQWQDHLEAHGVVRATAADKPLTQSPIADEPYGSVLVFRDPDNIQLELFSPPAG